MLSTLRSPKRADPVVPPASQREAASKPSDQGWEKTVRDQITSHPRIAVGVGLLAGLLAGWWVKR